MRPNVALRLSLATYDDSAPHPDARPGDSRLGGGIGSAQDPDHHFLEVIDHQMEVAATCMKIRDCRKAIIVLRRAYKLAELHSSPPLPITRLALASVRLAMCTALSQLGRHAQALDEARGAKRETDAIWETMAEASKEAQEADAIGVTTRPSAPLRKMIRQPPPWLTRVIEVGVQARQAIALELEYDHPLQNLVDAPLSPAKKTKEGEPRPPPSPLEEIAEHHHEAADMAIRLLPEDSHVRQAAERAHQHSHIRHEARHAPKPMIRALRSTTLAPVPYSPSSSPSASKPVPYAIPDFEKPMFQMGGEKPKTEDGMIKRHNGQLAPPPGDIYNHATRATQKAPRASSPGKGGRGASSPKDAAAKAGDQPPSPEPSNKSALSPSGQGVIKFNPCDYSVNPFSDWHNTVIDEGSMSYAQFMARSLEGQKTMMKDLRLHNRKFKNIEIKDLEATLYDNRVHCSASAQVVNTTKKRKDDTWKANSWQLTEAGMRKHGPVHLSQSKSSVTVREMSKAYKRAVNDTPAHVQKELNSLYC